QLRFDAVHQAAAAAFPLAIPFKAIDNARGALPLYHQAYASCFGALRRVAYARGQQKDVAFSEIDALALAVNPKVQVSVAAHLVEKLFVGIVVIIGAVVGTADHSDDKVAVLPDLLVADRRL